MNNVLTLGSIPLFKNLPPQQLAELGSKLHRIERPPHTRLIAANDRSDSVFIVVSGTVKICADYVEDKEVILALLGKGALLGEIGVVQSASRSANVVTLESTRLLQMHHAEFTYMLERFPIVALNLSAIMAQRLRLANARLMVHAATSTYRRVAHMLLALAQEHGENHDGTIIIPFRITQGDLAHMIGAGRVGVNRTICMLKADNVISVSRHHQIGIHNLAALKPDHKDVVCDTALEVNATRSN